MGKYIFSWRFVIYVEPCKIIQWILRWSNGYNLFCFQNIIFISALQDYTLYETWFGTKLDVCNLRFLAIQHMLVFLLIFAINWKWSCMNASFWVMGKHHVINLINFMTKQRKQSFLKEMWFLMNRPCFQKKGTQHLMQLFMNQ